MRSLYTYCVLFPLMRVCVLVLKVIGLPFGESATNGGLVRGGGDIINGGELSATDLGVVDLLRD